jgi:hypothetical protein
MLTTHHGRTLATIALALVAAPAATSRHQGAPVQQPEITVYKDPQCGCCARWAEHLRAGGFRVVVRDTSDVSAVKRRLGVPDRLASCHTGVVAGYVVEGHVPADLVRRLLRERPRASGLAVPGMPMGSPGMEGPQSDRYDVILFDREGTSRVYASR